MGTADSMGGALDKAPVAAFGRTQWAEYFNEFSRKTTDYDSADITLTQVNTQGAAYIASSTETTDVGFGYLRLYNVSGTVGGPTVQYDSGSAAGFSPIGVTTREKTSSQVATDAVFVARFALDDVDGSGNFIGLAELNATSDVMLLADGGVLSDNHIGFANKSSDGGNIYFTAAGTSVANAVTVESVLPSPLTDSLSSLETQDYVEVAVRLTGDKHYRGYVRRAGQKNPWKKIADGILSVKWNAQMLITFSNITTTSTTADMQIDYVYLTKIRDRIA